MVEAAQVLAEQRPMLAEFLCDIGLARADAEPDLGAILPAFDSWLRTQVVSADDVAYLAARLAAYICQHALDHRGAQVAVVDTKIWLRIPVEAGVLREFEPYRLAHSLAASYAAGQAANFAQVLQMLG